MVRLYDAFIFRSEEFNFTCIITHNYYLIGFNFTLDIFLEKKWLRISIEFYRDLLTRGIKILICRGKKFANAAVGYNITLTCLGIDTFCQTLKENCKIF